MNSVIQPRYWSILAGDIGQIPSTLRTSECEHIGIQDGKTGNCETYKPRNHSLFTFGGPFRSINE